MTDKFFNFIRFLAEIAISAAGALYYALAEVWGLPYGKEIVATCAAISTFLGIFTEWQRYAYNKAKEKAVEDATPIPEVLYAEIKREDIE